MDVPTLGEIKDAVRGLLQDDQFDDALLSQAANFFQYELFNENKTRLMESSATIEASAGDVTADFPGDLMHRISIYTTSPQVADIKEAYRDYETFMQMAANFATATSSQLRLWTTFGAAMRFSAPLNADYTFQVDYLREPVYMDNDSDDCEVPRRYMELLAYGTLARAMEINEDRNEAADVRDLMTPMLTTFKVNEGRGGGKTGPRTVIRTNRRRHVRGY